MRRMSHCTCSNLSGHSYKVLSSLHSSVASSTACTTLLDFMTRRTDRTVHDFVEAEDATPPQQCSSPHPVGLNAHEQWLQVEQGLGLVHDWCSDLLWLCVRTCLPL